jgi:glycosyltransferase involved in cell wall biosynthesis
MDTSSITTDAARPWPSVSVVVPTRNRPQLLRRAVTTILGQAYPGNLECIVVFDQSEPDLPWGDLDESRRLRLVRNQRTPGLAGARNTGAAVADSELLAFCDDDDEWLPDKLVTQVRCLQAHLGASVVTCGILIDNGERRIARVAPCEEVTHRQLLRSRMMELHPSTVLVRRSAFEQIGPVDEHIPGSYGEDYEWLLRAARVAPVLAVRVPLAVVHWHRASWFSHRWRTIIAALTYLIDKHAEFEQEPRGLARLYGQIAFAHAALGQRRTAQQWARRSLSLNWQERRAYLALMASLGLPASTIVRMANAIGRGV